MYTLGLVSKELQNQENKKIVLIGGCYDLLHVGHLRILSKAKKIGDILVVGINDNRFIKQTKGEYRPIITEQHRAEILLGLKCVDYVFITDRALYDERNLKAIKPSVLVFGKEKDKLERRKKIAQNIEKNFPNIKTVFLSSEINQVRTTAIETKILESQAYVKL